MSELAEVTAAYEDAVDRIEALEEQRDELVAALEEAQANIAAYKVYPAAEADPRWLSRAVTAIKWGLARARGEQP